MYNYDEVRRWTTEKKLKRMGQASASVLDCDRVVIPVRFCHLAESGSGATSACLTQWTFMHFRAQCTCQVCGRPRSLALAAAAWWCLFAMHACVQHYL